MARMAPAAVVFTLGTVLLRGTADAADHHDVVPLLIAPEADDVNDHSDFVALLPYVVRVPEASAIARTLQALAASPPAAATAVTAPFRVRISGEEVSTGIRWDHPKRIPVDHLVLIDVGTPGKPVLEARVFEAAQRIATAQTTAAPGRWTFRFIAGDERHCILSDILTPRNLVTMRADNALQRVALKPEVMEAMAKLFDGGPRTHVLVVIAPTPPVWLPRESTEWLSRDMKEKLSNAQRRSLGSEVQAQVRTADASGIAKLTDWIAGGHLIPIIVDPVPPEQSPQSEGLRLGVDEALARMTLPKLDDLSRPMPSLVEYSGTVVVPLAHIQRPASGGYNAELTLVAGKESVKSRETAIVERAVRSWMPRQLIVYRNVIRWSALLLVVMLAVAHSWRGLGDLNDELAHETRNAAFVFVGLAFGLAATLVGEGYLQFSVSTEAMKLGVFLTFLAIGLWFLGYALRLIKRDLAFLKS
jgi:hypothetical protein